MDLWDLWHSYQKGVANKGMKLWLSGHEILVKA